MTAPPLRILGLSGSLRAGSQHRGLLRAAAELTPSDVDVEIFDLRDVPPFDADLAELDPVVSALREKVAAADGVLLASPEYNFSVSGVLKNAIDWASRPAYRSPFRGKRCGIISAAPGPTGGARGQQHLKVILLSMAAEVHPEKELALGRASGLFDDAGELRDEDALARLREHLASFVAWVRS